MQQRLCVHQEARVQALVLDNAKAERVRRTVKQSSRHDHLARRGAAVRRLQEATVALLQEAARVRQFQIFRVSSSQPGVVECKRTPALEPKVVDLRLDGVDFTREALQSAMAQLERLPDRPVNPEKVADLHDKILPYVPDEHKGDALYQVPTADELV